MKKIPPEIELEFLTLLEIMEEGVGPVFIYEPNNPEIVWEQHNPSVKYSKERIDYLSDLMSWDIVVLIPDNKRD